MKINLLNRKEYRQSRDLAPFKNDLYEDLDLEPMLNIMCKHDRYVYQTCRNILSSPMDDYENIIHRQNTLRDAIANKRTIFTLYTTVAEVVTDLSNYRSKMNKDGNPLPAVRVIHSIEMLNLLAEGLEKLKAEIVSTYGNFGGATFREFYDGFLKEYDSEFMQLVHQKRRTLHALQVGGEIQISARIGSGLKSEEFLVNSVEEYQSKHKFDKIESLFSTVLKKNEIRISYDNLQLLRDCKDLESAGLLHVAMCFDEFSKDISRLFDTLRYQLAFYYGCCNLHSHMKGMTFALCFPEINQGTSGIVGTGIYDLSFAIRTLKFPEANDLSGNDTLLYLITGTNHGGKTTFIRSVGIVQLMAQCGLFVPAKTLSTGIFKGIYTHFVRSEDVTMTAGKLEEELARLSKIVDHMVPESLIFLNESFATTSEREGAAIAEDIVRAFFDNRVTCFFVTHIYAFAKKAFKEEREHTQFLQAERRENGERTYRITEGEPGKTGYGMELYEKIIGSETESNAKK